LNETIWGQITDPDYEWITPHQAEIEQLFAAAETKAKDDKADGAGGDKTKKAAAKPGNFSVHIIVELELLIQNRVCINLGGKTVPKSFHSTF
jgi:hypothetical protein